MDQSCLRGPAGKESPSDRGIIQITVLVMAGRQASVKVLMHVEESHSADQKPCTHGHIICYPMERPF
jgi:uncharacterized protein with FMN-binding domain